MTRNYAEEDSVKKGLASYAVAVGAAEGDVAQIDADGELTLAANNGGSMPSWWTVDDADESVQFGSGDASGITTPALTEVVIAPGTPKNVLQIVGAPGMAHDGRLLDMTTTDWAGGPVWYADGSFSSTLSPLADPTTWVAEWHNATDTAWAVIYETAALGGKTQDGGALPDISTAKFWAISFDPTNGAAKLLIKGVTLDGTVVTGSVNCT